MTDYPVGTIAGHGRTPGPFQGTPAQFPDGWVIPMGQTIPPDQHANPRKKGQHWKLIDLSRQIVTGTSTSLESDSDDQGVVTGVNASNRNIPGEYPLVRIR